MKPNKQLPYRIKRRCRRIESRGYDKDSTTVSSIVVFDVIRGNKIIDTFNSISTAIMYINSKSLLGKKLLNKMKLNNSKISKLNSEIAKVESKSLKIIQKLSSTNMKGDTK